MPNPRLDSFRAMGAKNPGNGLGGFGLAKETMKEGLFEEAAEQLRAYLGIHEDEGNAYGRLAEALTQLGRVEEARAALRDGIDAARRFGHPSMAAEFEGRLEEMEDG